MRRETFILSVLASISFSLNAQSVIWISSTEGNEWEQTTLKLGKKALTAPGIEVEGNEDLLTFKAWGTCFNERGWDALNMLTPEQQKTILGKLFSHEGDLRFTMGRFSMNANDYARDWYSCDEVPGDFQLEYFDIERDKTTLIPYIKAAQEYNPELTFWISPWSPPSWMKINQYYSVVSDKEYNHLDPRLDILLFEGDEMTEENLFPKRLAMKDYLVQDPRYLQAYADYFCKFISAYQEEGIPVKMVMFQNEPWSYTPYPGCAWTPEGILRFNTEFLAPALQKQHPQVSLYLGTINTNRFDLIDEILSDPRMPESIEGVGFQWEGGQILPAIREKYPDYKYVQTESECGWGSFDWAAAEHTFSLINHYLGNGCEEYTFWNAILSGNGESGWGWKQNALIRVDPDTRTATYTPEYYAVKHYSNFITPGSKIQAFKNDRKENLSLMAVKDPEGRFLVFAGNFNDESETVAIRLGERYINAILPPHSLNTFKVKLK